jgi:predicted nucleic acid-binding Zn ribbon protein
MSSDAKPDKVGALVDRFLAEKGLDRQVKRLEVMETWPDVVGPAVAEVTEPRSVSGGTLFVEVRSSAWLMELDLMKGRILAEVNRERDEDARIEKLVFVLAEGG